MHLRRTRFLPGPGAVAPLVTPPQTVTVNGLDAFTARTGVGAAPRLAWSAPAAGTAHGYGVNVYLLGLDSATGQYQKRIASFVTKDTSLRLPAGLLTGTNQYVFAVSARHDPATDVEVTPNQSGLPFGMGTAITAAMTP